MKSPAQLRTTLNQYPDLDTAAKVYHEASGIIKQYAEIKREAEQAAFDRMPAGTMKCRTASGHNCGYTQPKAKRLDKEKWDAYLASNPDVASQYHEAQAFISDIQAGFMTMGDARFYVR